MKKYISYLLFIFLFVFVQLQVKAQNADRQHHTQRNPTSQRSHLHVGEPNRHPPSLPDLDSIRVLSGRIFWACCPKGLRGGCGIFLRRPFPETSGHHLIPARPVQTDLPAARSSPRRPAPPLRQPVVFLPPASGASRSARRRSASPGSPGATAAASANA